MPAVTARQHFSQQHRPQGQQHKGVSYDQEQRQQQQSSKAAVPAAATAVRIQDKAVGYVGLAADGEMQLRTFGCTSCDV